MKTNSLRKLVKQMLDEVAVSHYQRTPHEKMYPHIVFEFRRTNLQDMNRDDVLLEVHVWEKDNPAKAEDMADVIEKKLHNQNLPQEDILPTFYRENRLCVEDEDKSINHIVLEFSVQNYERG